MMLRRRLYYAFKPYLPWRLRNAIRRASARRIREKHRATWPINESAASIPQNWLGWPGEKEFAFVLTHDVEGKAGLEKCRRLAELEMELGFRSSFNFVPEGSYSVPEELRTWLTANGFEVGIHDLHHDGKLYHSRASFKKKAERINHYINSWKTCGFRSGFMLHELDWIHDLDIVYDASTFDTDPFEPQPESAGTIFPYWIPAPSGGRGRGYIELPYTLPQDSTLFLVLGEKSEEIWLKKTDWIANHGGMALVIVHPDYLQFDGDNPLPHTFPVSYYSDFLKHIASQYKNAYWHGTPQEVARHFCQSHPFGASPAITSESKPLL